MMKAATLPGANKSRRTKPGGGSIGLAHKLPSRCDSTAGEMVRPIDFAMPESKAVVARREMERRFAMPTAIAAQ